MYEWQRQLNQTVKRERRACAFRRLQIIAMVGTVITGAFLLFFTGKAFGGN